MKPLIRTIGMVCLVWHLLAVQPASAQGHVAGTLWSASEVLEAMQALPLKCIPPALMNDAQGIAIIPGVIKGGFVIGGRYGQGVVLGRNPDGTWSNPVFVTLAGGSIGWQVGVQSTDIILVFKTRKSLERLLQGKGKVTLGVDAAVAAGPAGRQVEAGTDAQLSAEIYSYSRSRGLFVGVSLEGAGITNDADANRIFSLQPRPEEIQASDKLKTLLLSMGGPRPAVMSAPPMMSPSPFATPIVPSQPPPSGSYPIAPGQAPPPRWMPQNPPPTQAPPPAAPLPAAPPVRPNG